MKLGPKFRLIVLELGILMVLAMLAWTGYRLITVRFYRETAAAKERTNSLKEFAVYQIQYYEIANHLEAEVGSLNHALLRFAFRNDEAEKERFQQGSDKLAKWITEQQATTRGGKTIEIAPPLAFTVDFGKLLDEITTTYGKYREAARVLTASSGSFTNAEQRLKAFETADEESRKLLALAVRCRAYGESLIPFNVANPPLPWGAAGALVLLLALGVACGWLAVVVYRRGWQLIESRSTIERQKKLAARGEHAASVAHEIRNPLTAIGARLHTLQHALLEGTAEHEDALVIRREITRLNRIVESFLQLARPSEPEPVPVSAAAALQEVQDLLAPQFAKQAIAVKFDTVTDAKFRADPYQLKQVLINLVKNAAESIGHDGTITLSADIGTQTLKGHPTQVVTLAVQDTGPGIPADVQERLFEPFFTTKEAGTGLGLSIASQIVDRHGGVLNFDSKKGKGTVFRVILPIDPTELNDASHPHH